MWWVYIFQLPLCLNIKRHLRLQTLPRAPPTMLWLRAEPSHNLSFCRTVKWSPTDLNLGLENSSKSSEWHNDCTQLKLRSQSKLLAKKYMAALRNVLKPMAYQWSWASCRQMSGRKMNRSDPIRSPFCPAGPSYPTFPYFTQLFSDARFRARSIKNGDHSITAYLKHGNFNINFEVCMSSD